MVNSTPPYEWIFSGIGVAVVSWFCAWAYRRYHKVHAAGKQPEHSSQVRISDSTVIGTVAGRDISIGTYVQGEAALAETSNEEYRETPTTVEIAESLRPVSLYLKESVANSYAGLKVRWRMQLHGIRRLSDGRIDVTLRNENEGPIVVFIVNLDDYPILKTVHGGEPIEVMGTIDYVQTNTPIHLKDVKLKFLDQVLSDAGIETQLFPREPRAQVEDMNREFVGSQKDRQAWAKMPTTDEDQSSWPDVILECQWPSFVESKIPGSHTVRNRPWILRYRGPDAVYNVCVHRIRFGAYKALFPFPVRTLTDAASVYPIICRESDGLMITTDDLESLIRNPPSGCDVQQYAVKTDGNQGEEIQLEGFIPEVEIPVAISYDDKNGNYFKIKYLLHYDGYMQKGEMIRIGGIEKVAPK